MSLININKEVLFLLPYAGGNCYCLRGLIPELSPIEVVSLEYPGRGKRINERLLRTSEEIVCDLFDCVMNHINNCTDFYIYGHSMGTLMGYLLIHKVLKDTGKKPKHFFVSGRGGPSIVDNTARFLLPSHEFRENLKELGGCPEEVLKNNELMNFFEPVLRADFESIETYHHIPATKLNVPITGFHGLNGDTNAVDMNLWQQESIYPIRIFGFSGNHFFIFDHWKEIGAIINETIRKRI
jgi:surfactin synthase thioesterase subunit